MDRRLLEHYEQELKYLREEARAFGAAFPKLAGRLGVNAPGEADPYVERLLEGVAFLAARVQLKLADEFPKFGQHMLEALYPHYLAPTPSATVLEFQPKPGETALVAGPAIPAGASATIPTLDADRSMCTYRTAAPVRLWPLAVTRADYVAGRAAVADLTQGAGPGGEAAFVLRLETTADVPLAALACDSLTFYVGGAESLAGRIYEQIRGSATGAVLREGKTAIAIPPQKIGAPAFSPDVSMLPGDPRSFRGYRMLQEYFSFPQRFFFLEVSGLAAAFRQCAGRSAELVIPLSVSDKRLSGTLSAGAFRLFCAPAVNLFPKRCDPVLLEGGSHEFRVVPDRLRLGDFEVYQVTDVYAADGESDRTRTYYPAYRADPRLRPEDAHFYTIRRWPRGVPSAPAKGRLSTYAGTDAWIALSSLPNARGAPEQIYVRALCTNRDLPDILRATGSALEFTLEEPAPVAAVKAVTQPTRPMQPFGFEDARLLDNPQSRRSFMTVTPKDDPRLVDPAWLSGDRLWRLIGHLRPNFESLFSGDDGAVRLREHLALYVRLDDPAARRAVDGLIEATARSAVRRVHAEDALSFARGHRIEVTLDETAYGDTGAFLFGEIVDRFLSEFATVNAFVETAVSGSQRGEIARFGPRRGERPTI